MIYYLYLSILFIKLEKMDHSTQRNIHKVKSIERLNKPEKRKKN